MAPLFDAAGRQAQFGCPANLDWRSLSQPTGNVFFIFLLPFVAFSSFSEAHVVVKLAH